MKPELLETLLLDRALGELSPEVAALLDTHLAQNPAAAARAAEFSATLDLARAAVAAPPATAPRAFDRAQLRREHRALRSAARRTEMLRLAACLLIGLGLGWLARPAPKATVPVVASATFTPSRATDPATQFWSVSRFAPETSRLRSPKKP